MEGYPPRAARARTPPLPGGRGADVWALTSGVSRKRSASAPRARYSRLGRVAPQRMRSAATCGEARRADGETDAACPISTG